jgi:hypothetical protein
MPAPVIPVAEPHQPTRAAGAEVHRNWPGTPLDEPESPDRVPVNETADADARSLSTDAANDCGPPLRSGTSERSVPFAGGPYDCPSRSGPDARDGGACHERGSGEYRTRARAERFAGSAPMASGASVLRWQRDSETLAALLAPAREDGSAPPGGHPGAKSMLGDAALVPRAIRWLHPSFLPSEPGKLVGREQWGQVEGVRRGRQETPKNFPRFSTFSTFSTFFLIPGGVLRPLQFP